MKLWIDCEFNSYLGELISLALVADNGEVFYRVLSITEPVNPWVAEHVMPILGAEPIPLAQFHDELEGFLMQFDSVHVIADWPEDIAHLMHVLITGPGERLNTPPLTMEVVRIDAPSAQPHNALYDAIGIANYMREHPAPAGGDAGERK